MMMIEEMDDVGKLAVHIEDEVTRKKCSFGIVRIWHPVSD
jgi:2-methylisocitrate lyase-like PEP mutase family enzyme